MRNSAVRVGRGVGGVWRAAIFASFVFAVLFYAANVWFGPLNQDEGWYLLAAQNVRRGMVPYRDFLYTQGPVMPFAYAAISPLWSPFGVLGGRVVTAAFGLAAAVLCALAAARLARRIAGDFSALPAFFVAFSLLALSPDWAYFSSIPKTYALASLFLAAALALCSADCIAAGGLRGRAAAFFAGVFVALCAGTRATLIVAAVPIWCALFFAAIRRRVPASAPVSFAVGCAVALVLLFAPPLLFARENFVFSQTYHTARAAAPLGRWIVLRAAFVCFLAQGHPGIVAAAALLFASGGWRILSVVSGSSREPYAVAVVQAESSSKVPAATMMWCAFAVAFVLLTAAHALVPFPYADYNTPVMPLAAIALGVPLGIMAGHVGSCAPRAAARVALAVLFLGVSFVAASQWPMKWVGGRQDRFWFSTRGESSIASLRRAGRILRSAAVESSATELPLFTQDAYLAVEARLPVVPGLEMGPFSVFPGLSDGEARSRHVHTPATLRDAVESSPAKFAAKSGYTFAIACPSTDPLPDSERDALVAALDARFPCVIHSDPRFGQQETILEIRTEAGSHVSK